MKTCLITPSFPPVDGGTETAVQEIAYSLAERNHSVTVITLNHRTAAQIENLNNNITIYRTPVFPTPIGKSSMSQFGIYKMILRTHRIINFDILHQFHVFYLGAACIYAKRKTKLPLITSLMGMDTYDPFNPIPRVFNPYMKWVMNSSDAITSPCLEVVNRARRQGLIKEASIIPHGVNLKRFHPNYNSASLRKKLGVSSSEIMVLSIQRLCRRKKLEYLLHSIPLVLAKNPQVKFVIGGQGSEKSQLEALVEQLNIQCSVIFPGFISENELPLYYAACDIFALHTMYEAFGIVLAEAMASGKPVISTSVGSVPEVIDDGQTGLVIPAEDSLALSKAILKLVENKELRLMMGRAGLEKARREYGWAGIIEGYLREYEAVLEKMQ
ncbi:glycosyltransferase family 4 protein [Chloroflexota bacterium]